MAHLIETIKILNTKLSEDADATTSVLIKTINQIYDLFKFNNGKLSIPGVPGLAATTDVNETDRADKPVVDADKSLNGNINSEWSDDSQDEYLLEQIRLEEHIARRRQLLNTTTPTTVTVDPETLVSESETLVSESEPPSKCIFKNKKSFNQQLEDAPVITRIYSLSKKDRELLLWNIFKKSKKNVYNMLSVKDKNYTHEALGNLSEGKITIIGELTRDELASRITAEADRQLEVYNNYGSH